MLIIVASLSKDDTTPVNDGEHFIRDISLTGIGDSLKEKSPMKDNVAVENEYVQMNDVQNSTHHMYENIRLI